MKIERITWIDSCGFDGWHASGSHTYAPMICATFGAVIDEGPQHVALATSIADIESDAGADVHGVMVIPLVAILSRELLANFDFKVGKNS